MSSRVHSKSIYTATQDATRLLTLRQCLVYEK